MEQGPEPDDREVRQFLREARIGAPGVPLVTPGQAHALLVVDRTALQARLVAELIAQRLGDSDVVEFAAVFTPDTAEARALVADGLCERWEEGDVTAAMLEAAAAAGEREPAGQRGWREFAEYDRVVPAGWLGLLPTERLYGAVLALLGNGVWDGRRVQERDWVRMPHLVP